MRVGVGGRGEEGKGSTLTCNSSFFETKLLDLPLGLEPVSKIQHGRSIWKDLTKWVFVESG